MLGRTHYKLGIGYYLIFLPLTITIFTVNRLEHLLLGVLVAAFAALLPDIDTASSKINTQNPITGIPIKIIDSTTKVLLFIVRCGTFIAAAYFLWIYSEGQATSQKPLLRVIAGLLVLLGIFGGRITKHLPVFTWLEKVAIKYGSRLKKIVIHLFVYAVVAVGYIYNFKTSNDWVIYFLGFILVASTTFPHRTFTHSLEGFLLYSFYAYHLADLFGYPSLSMAFFVGYGSHLYLSDVFNPTGVPLSFAPYLLNGTGIHGYMKDRNNKVYDAIYKVLSIRLRINLMNTGSRWEVLYYSLVITAAAFVLHGSCDSIQLYISMLK